jgi:hypothetical protein
MTNEHAPLIDQGNYPEINAAGLAEFYVIRDGRVRFVMYDWFRDGGIWQRRIVGLVTRPLITLEEEHRPLWQRVYERAAVPLDYKIEAVH